MSTENLPSPVAAAETPARARKTPNVNLHSLTLSMAPRGLPFRLSSGETINVKKLIALAALLVLCGPAVGQQQDWTFSDVVTGTSVTDSGSNPYSTTVEGTIVLNGSGAAETLTYNFSAGTPAGQFQLQGNETLALGDGGGNGQAATGWIVPVTNGQGAVTGFDTVLPLNNNQIADNAYSSTLSIVNGVTTLQWLASVGDCSNSINCTINASGTGGVFTAAPELDWSRAIAALTLLAGLALILKSSRSRVSVGAERRGIQIAGI
jgi:hypothetical protein